MIASALLALLTLAAMSVQAAPPVSVPVRAVQVAAHTWLVQGTAGQVSRANEGFNSNAAFVVTGDGVVVFDALGSPPLGTALVDAIRTVTPQPIRRVIVSILISHGLATVSVACVHH